MRHTGAKEINAKYDLIFWYHLHRKPSLKSLCFVRFAVYLDLHIVFSDLFLKMGRKGRKGFNWKARQNSKPESRKTSGDVVKVSDNTAD